MLRYTEYASSPAPSFFFFFTITAIEQEKQAGES